MKPTPFFARLSSLVFLGNALLLGAAPAARADVTIVSEINATGLPAAMPQSAQKFPQTVTTFYKGDSVRTEVGGVVTIQDAAADKLYTLDPVKKTYTETSLAKLMDQVNPFLAMMKFDVKGDVKEGGETRTILGMPAKNYRIAMTMAMSMAAPGAPDASGGQAAPSGPLMTMKLEGEHWTTEGLELRTNAQQMMASSALRLLGPMMQGMKPLTEKMNVIKGTPLSSKMTITLTTGQALAGAALKEPMVITSEAKSIGNDPLADTLFKVPADYKLREAAPMMPGMGGGQN